MGDQAIRLQKREKTRGVSNDDSGAEAVLTGSEPTHEEIRRHADLIYRERAGAPRDLESGKKGAADWLQAERSLREGRKHRKAKVESEAGRRGRRAEGTRSSSPTATGSRLT